MYRYHHLNSPESKQKIELCEPLRSMEDERSKNMQSILQWSLEQSELYKEVFDCPDTLFQVLFYFYRRSRLKQIHLPGH